MSSPVFDPEIHSESPLTSAPEESTAGRAVLYNRFLMVLGFFGLFEAGYLSLAKLMDTMPACGVGPGGCATVLSSKAAVFLGIPVAFIGFGAYAVLTALAVYRGMKGLASTRRLVTLGYGLTAFGALVSLGLQFYSFFVVHEVCKWCLASAVTMILSLITYALLTQALDDGGATDRTTPIDSFLLPTGLAVVVVLALGIGGYQLSHSGRGGYVLEADKLKVTKLVPDNPNAFGDPAAPITIVEFADLMCPACEANTPRVHEFVRQHPGKVRVVFRHFPLDKHKLGALSSAMAEYAAEKGKFWDFTLAAMAKGQQATAAGAEQLEDVGQLMDAARSVGLNVNDMTKRLENDNDPIYARVTADKNAANALGVQSTPTFFVQAKGLDTQVFTAGSVLDALKDQPAYSKILGG